MAIVEKAANESKLQNHSHIPQEGEEEMKKKSEINLIKMIQNESRKHSFLLACLPPIGCEI